MYTYIIYIYIHGIHMFLTIADAACRACSIMHMKTFVVWTVDFDIYSRWMVRPLWQRCLHGLTQQSDQAQIVDHVFYMRMSHVTCEWDEWVVSQQWIMWHMRTSHVTCKWVMSHTNDSCHVRMDCVIAVDQVTHFKWVVSYMNGPCYIRMSYVTYECVVVIYEWVISYTNDWCHIRMSCVTYEWVMSHTGESCQGSGSRDTHKRVSWTYE